eukprot:m51a1_g13804 hypothetical protein (1200) ;mRNA; r:382471-386916
MSTRTERIFAAFGGPVLSVGTGVIHMYKSYTAELLLPRRWRLARGLGTEDVLGALQRCTVHADAGPSPAVRCGLCGDVLELSDARVRSDEQLPGDLESFCATVRSKCSSSRKHLHVANLVVAVALGGVAVYSQPFSVFAREPGRYKKYTRPPQQQHDSSGSSGSSSSSPSSPDSSGVARPHPPVAALSLAPLPAILQSAPKSLFIVVDIFQPHLPVELPTCARALVSGIAQALTEYQPGFVMQKCCLTPQLSVFVRAYLTLGDAERGTEVADNVSRGFEFCEQGGRVSRGRVLAYTSALDEDYCWRGCQSRDNCTAWAAETNQVSGVQCTWYTGAVEVSGGHGSAECAAVQQCRGATGGAGAVAERVVARSDGPAADCAFQCRKRRGCNAFTLDLSGAQAVCVMWSALNATFPSASACTSEVRCRAQTAAPASAEANATHWVTGGDAECAWHCRQTPLCAGYTLDVAVLRARQRCTLLARSDEAVLSASASAACTASLHCEASAALAAPARTPARRVRDDVECARLCAATAGCSAWSANSTADAAGAACALVVGGGGLAATPAAGVCSHVMQCAPRRRAGAGAAPMRTALLMGGDAECAALCRATERCRAFAHDHAAAPALQPCTLYADAGGAGAGEDAGAAGCLARLRCSAATAVGGQALRSEFVVRGGDYECFASCAGTEGCAAYAVSELAGGEVHRQRCELFARADSNASSAGACSAALLCAAGTRVADVAPLPHSSVVYGGDAECAGLCHSTAGCAAWDLDVSGSLHAQACRLYASRGSSRASPGRCAAASQCSAALDAQSADLEPPFAAPLGDAQCAHRCRATAGCTAFVYEDQWRTCTLKRGAVAPRAAPASGRCLGVLRCRAATGSSAPASSTHEVRGGDAECESLCVGTAGCTGWTLSSDEGTPGLQTCGLLANASSAATAVPLGGSCLGELPCVAAARARDFELLVPAFAVEGPAECRESCAKAPMCVGFLVKLPTADSPKHACHLQRNASLETVPDAHSCQGFIPQSPSLPGSSASSLSGNSASSSSSAEPPVSSSRAESRREDEPVQTLDSSEQSAICDAEGTACLFIKVDVPAGQQLNMTGMAEDLARAMNATQGSVRVVDVGRTGSVHELLVVVETEKAPEKVSEELLVKISDPLSDLWKRPNTKNIVKHFGARPWTKRVAASVASAAPCVAPAFLLLSILPVLSL